MLYNCGLLLEATRFFVQFSSFFINFELNIFWLGYINPPKYQRVSELKVWEAHCWSIKTAPENIWCWQAEKGCHFCAWSRITSKVLFFFIHFISKGCYADAVTFHMLFLFGRHKKPVSKEDEYHPIPKTETQLLQKIGRNSGLLRPKSGLVTLFQKVLQIYSVSSDIFDAFSLANRVRSLDP